MDDEQRYILIRLSLDDRLARLSPEYLLDYLDYLPDRLQLRDLEDLLGVLTGYPQQGYGSDDWAIAQDMWRRADPGHQLCLAIDGDELVVKRVVGGEVIYSAEIPGWLLRLDTLIRFLAEASQRPPYASELRDLLLGIWLPVFRKDFE